jgi:hypothetical protein
MRLEVDAGRFAVLGAEAAIPTFFLVEANLEERETCQETQRRSYRTDGVAVGTTVAPSQHDNDGKGDGGN